MLKNQLQLPENTKDLVNLMLKGARKKGATLRDWFEKENWINVETGEPCGASTKRRKKKR